MVRRLKGIQSGLGLVQQVIGVFANLRLALAQARDIGAGLARPTGSQLHQPATAAHVAQDHGPEMVLRPGQRVAKMRAYRHSRKVHLETKRSAGLPAGASYYDGTHHLPPFVRKSICIDYKSLFLVN